MSVSAMGWVLTEADVRNPTEAMVLAVMADRARQDGRGVYYSHSTLAAYARVSVSTVQRTLRALEERGVIVRGDQSAVAHIQERHRPVVWDLPLPERSVRLTPRPEDDRSDDARRSVKAAASDRSPVTDDPRTNPRSKTAAFSPAQAEAFAAGQPVGCTRHGSRRPACDDCQRQGVALDRVRTASDVVAMEAAAQARAAMRDGA